MKSSNRNNLAKAAVLFSLSVILVALAGVVLLNRQYVQDTVLSLVYKPTADIESIEDRMGITSRGERIFRASSPSVESANVFNKSCPRREVSSPVVGCYTSSSQIFIYNVTNDKLDGIKDVTAAHELLHAVWARMSGSERRLIGIKLREAYSKLSKDELKSRMDYYSRTQKGQEVNELHSILGTEFSDLDEELEAHYNKYFDRSKVLGWYKSYQSEYDSLRSDIESLQANLTELSDSVSSRIETYNANMKQLDADISNFNDRAKGEYYSSQSQFDNDRAKLIRRGESLNNERSAINNDITNYNEMYEKYKNVAQEIQALNDSIDSLKVIDSTAPVENL